MRMGRWGFLPQCNARRATCPPSPRASGTSSSPTSKRWRATLCGILARDFAAHKVRTWLDQKQPEIQAQTTLDCFAKSRVYLLFLTKGIFRRKFVLVEARHALKLGKPVLLVHEADPTKKDAYAKIGKLIAEAPPDLKVLFKDHESEAFQRRAHLQEAMVLALVDRVVEAMGRPFPRPPSAT